MSVSGDPGTTVKTDEPDPGRIAVESERLIASNKIEGTPVYNRQGEHLGAVHHLMVDKITGQIAYAVISFGGLLGIGERYHPIPWKVVVYDLAKKVTWSTWTSRYCKVRLISRRKNYRIGRVMSGALTFMTIFRYLPTGIPAEQEKLVPTGMRPTHTCLLHISCTAQNIFSGDADRIGSLVDPLVNQVCRVNINCQCQRGPGVFPLTGRKDWTEGTLS